MAPSDVGAPHSFDPWPKSQVHVEWGVTGAELAAARGDAVVVVDVLSFSTALCVATSRGVTCLVYSEAEIAKLGGSMALAERLDARPLSNRRRVEPGGFSLSPGSLLRAEAGQRVLFTSLNGAAVTAASAAAPALMIAGLRNAQAAVSAILELLTRPDDVERVTIVPCGEHWSSVEPTATGTRYGIEDWLGAGLLCRRLGEAGLRLTAEAEVAAHAWKGPEVLRACVSARELIAAGFSEDVDLALEVDADRAVPVRDDAQPTGRAFVGRWPVY